MKKLLLVFGTVLFLSSTSIAQTITGTVTDKGSGETLPGVNIKVKGTTTGASTASNGDYTLTVPSLQDTLVFSFVGFQTQAVPINGRATINIQMAEQTLEGQEMVVVGYGTQRKMDLTGAVDVVDVEAVNENPTGSVLESLQGQVSGVSIINSPQPGQEPNISIRGYNTFGNNQPLFIVDGIPTQNIATLSSGDIASVQVLKDAAAASIYGSRASNGVIIITTKEGEGELTVNYKSYVGYQVPETDNVWNALSSREMGELAFMVDRHAGLQPGDNGWGTQSYGQGSEPVLPDYIAPLGAEEGSPAVDPSNYYVNPHYRDPSELSEFYRITRANKEGTDWFNALVDPALTTKHNLSISGGNGSENYLFSLEYLNRQGAVMQTYLKRYNIRINTNFNINENIRIGENLAYTLEDNPSVGSYTIAMTHRMHPLIPVHDIMGNFAGSYGTNLTTGQNPIAMRYRTRNNGGIGKRLFGNAFAELNLLDNNLLVRTTFGGELYSGSSHSFRYPSYENSFNPFTTNAYSEEANNGYDWTWSNTATYEKTFADKHNFKVMAGVESQMDHGRTVGGSTQDYFSYDPNYWTLDTGSGTKNNYSNRNTNALFSLFGKLNYSYDNKYLIGATIRRDGSSKFLNHKYGVFPAVSIGYRISEESFMEDISWISSLKVRGSYGVMGNQLNVNPNNPYTLFTSYKESSYYFITGSNSNLQLGFLPSRIGNPAAKWERDIQMNFGIDATFFDGKLDATIDYYQKDINGLLYNPEIPGSAGAANQPFRNVGNMSNKGIDLTLHGNTSLSRDLNFDIRVNMTTYNNEIKQIAEGIDYFGGSSADFGTSFVRNAVGHPLSAFYGYDIVGFWDNKEEIEDVGGTGYQPDVGIDNDGNPFGLGHFRYADINGDGHITTDDRTFLGSPHPDFSYGINIDFSYKNWDFSMFLYGTQGNEIWNQIKWWTDFYSSDIGGKSHTALYDSWTQENHDASVAIQEGVTSLGTYGAPNSYFVEDGSYLRAKNIQLGYSLPAQSLQKIGIKSLRVYGQVANAFTITGYSGIDPEIGGGTTSFGIDFAQYPTARQFQLGVDLSF